jgi:pimeloyl-ACP methyl ester carboxylesterase
MTMRAFALPLLLFYPLYGGVMFAKQQAILFPAASDQHHAFQATVPANAQLVEIPVTYGNVRAMYWRAGTTASRGAALLYLHGNFEHIEDSFARLQPLVRAGYSILQLEYPGFGGADGAPNFEQITEAADTAYDWLARQADVDAQQIVVMGYSIGGGAAGELTRRRQPAALILLSTYTSLEDIAHRYFLPGFLLRYPWDTLARVKTFAGPVFVEHGRSDKVIPFGMGERLASAKPQIEFAALDCGHDDCHFDRSLFTSRLPAWLAAQGLQGRSESTSPENSNVSQVP